MFSQANGPGMADFQSKGALISPGAPKLELFSHLFSFVVTIFLCVTVSGTDESDFGPRSNLRSGPILAAVIHSLLGNPAKIGPEIRFSFRFALPARMLFTKRNENRA